VRYFLAVSALALWLVPRATAMASQTTVPFSYMMTNPCTPADTVAVTGTMHAVMFSNGSKGTIQIDWPDTSGISLTTGTLYQANDATHVFVFSSGQITISDSYELVSQNGTSNFLVHESILIDLFSEEITLVRGGEECSGPTPAP
jgi:hypothetical protein